MGAGSDIWMYSGMFCIDGWYFIIHTLFEDISYHYQSHMWLIKVLQSLPVTALDYLWEVGLKILIHLPNDSEVLIIFTMSK